MKKIYVIVIHILAIITVSLNIYQYNNHQAKSIINSTKNNNSNLLSIMMENDQGEYEESNKNEFPEEGYLLDTKRSGCENGGTLEYQDHNVYVKASSSERCYVYFAKDTILNECELGYANASSGVCTILKTYGKDQTLYYHDGKADYDGMENSNLEAEDDSYRYSGANPNNYVCFGGDCSNNPNDPNYKNLYRIIGLFKNEDNGQYEMKIIKADGTTKEDLGENDAYSSNYGGYEEYYRGKIYNKLAYYFYNNSDKEHMTVENNTNVNMWKESNLNTKNLNDTYYNSLNSTYQKMI